MPTYSVKNNLQSQLYVPEPVDRFLKQGERVVVETTAAAMDNAAIRAMDRRSLITVQAVNDLGTSDHIEVPSLALIQVGPNTHEGYDSLVHNVAESHFQQVVYTGDDVTEMIFWDSAGKVVRVRDVSFAYDIDGDVTQTVTRQYGPTGIVVATLVKSFSYNPDGTLASITAVRS